MAKKRKAASSGKSAMVSKTSSKTCNMTPLCWVCCILLVVGALNWGLIGLFNMDVVAWLLGPGSMPTRVVYVLIGLAGLAKLWKIVSKM